MTIRENGDDCSTVGIVLNSDYGDSDVGDKAMLLVGDIRCDHHKVTHISFVCLQHRYNPK